MSFTPEDRRLAAANAEEWHLNKGVIVTIIVACISMLCALFVQTIYVTRYFSGQDARITTLEIFKTEQLAAYNKKQDEQDARIRALEEMRSQLAVIQSVQQDVIKRLDIQTDRINKAIEIMNIRH